MLWKKQEIWQSEIRGSLKVAKFKVEANRELF
jgi:hypothetical protein